MRGWDDPVFFRAEGLAVVELRTVTLLGDDPGGRGATPDRTPSSHARDASRTPLR